VTVLGVRVDRLTLAEVLDLTERWVAEARARRARGAPIRTRQVVTLNPEMVMAARRDDALRAVLNGADLVLADGVGVVLAARLRGVRGIVRLTGVETVGALAERAAARGWRLFLLGAPPGVAAEAAVRLRAEHVGLLVVGTHAGSPLPAEDGASAERIREGATDVLCVAYGAPAQEWWIDRNREALGATVAIGVGGTLDFLAGQVPRAPAALRRMGLEWAFRLWRQPWRWRRMLALPHFALAVAGETLRLRRVRVQHGQEPARHERIGG
jgi:N-acetylglucosaminyldiphosphoundecaprenol N-acetyl-beta-D-mannosaminyltransferase